MNNWKQRSLVIIFNFNIKVDTGMRSSSVSYYQYLGYCHAVLDCLLSTQTPHEIMHEIVKLRQGSGKNRQEIVIKRPIKAPERL